MSKYQPLQDYLKASKADTIHLSFEEIEAILGFKLPPSSHKYRAWWSNNPSNNVMTEAWLNAGFETGEVNLETRKLKFQKANDNFPLNDRIECAQKPSFKSIFGALKGQMIIMPDVDLTEPLWPEPEADYDVLA
jgi:hypothetical protein